ncbi:1-acyl-sn-glycerol-3-phosphate acyltransferase [Hymenobacter aerilatus]|uniref:1-acyl-sn-glycerol-3-phosphate acyltransferase n=1 Tax=Hymenobacter aerilatus TaxID=2932251 RepID=A0A8T9SY86_9BACT|nr:lysophospholipid acyltransferase family protein [Hymenobacter aerilatus]UOR05693.1 1-acyl-sn-glycerol-3-phosphate acyltransferase [Hymenobacter aerilatus]
MRQLLRFIGQRLYTTWCTFWFVSPFFYTYPLQWVLARKPTRHPWLHRVNRFWSSSAIFMWGMPVSIVRKNQLPAGQPCVYVANHSSYIDIPLLFRAIPGFLNIIGKSSLADTPLWGPIFGRTYITVNRDSAVSRGRSMVLAKQSLAAGRSVVIFPEGTISEKPGEKMMPFKDGAFQLAIAAGVPLVPVSMPLNHRFMPDVGGLRIRYTPLRIVLHEPIPTINLTMADVPALKQRAHDLIASEFQPEAAGLPPAFTWRPTPPVPRAVAQETAPHRDDQTELSLPNS